MKLCKADVVTYVAEKNGVSLVEAKRAVDAVFNAMTDALADGRTIELRGFGVFSTVDVQAQTRRNPGTGETVDVPAKRRVRFRAGRPLREAVCAA